MPLVSRVRDDAVVTMQVGEDQMARTGQQMRQRTAKAMGQPKASGSGSTRTATVPRSSLGDRLRYRFDNCMSRGTPALIAWLCVATLVLIVVFTVIVTVFRLRGGGENAGFFREMVQSLFHALDPGTVAGDGEGQWRFLLTMLVLTIGGLFIVSALIGVIAAGIDTKLADLRRGRSIVLEKDHTVILGWSDSIFTIVRELTVANESRTQAGDRGARRPRQGRDGGATCAPRSTTSAAPA